MKKIKQKLLTSILAVSVFATVKAQTTPFCSGVIIPSGNSIYNSNSTCPQSSTTWVNKYSKPQTYILNASTPVITLKITLHIFTQNNGSSALWENTNSTVNGIPALNTFLAGITNGQTERFSVPRNATYEPNFNNSIQYINDSRVQYEVTNIYFYPNTFLYTKYCIYKSF